MGDRVKWCLVVLVSAVALVSCSSGAPHRNSFYRNPAVGVQVRLPEDWAIYTSRTRAPPVLAPSFPRGKHRNQSPLYIAVRRDGQAFSLIATNKDGPNTRADFIKVLQSRAASREIHRVRYSETFEAMRWIYSTDEGLMDAVVHETLAAVNGRTIALSFWTPAPLFSRNEATFDQLAALLEVRGPEGWVSLFEGVDASFEEEDIPNVEIRPLPEFEFRPIVCQGERNPPLFRVEHEGAVVHILGSIHIGRPDLYPLGTEAEQAFVAAQRVFVETDTRSLNAIEIQSSGGELPRGQTLRDQLSPESYDRMLKHLDARGIHPRLVDKSPPKAVAAMLMSIELLSLGYAPQDGVEAYLIERLDGRPLGELESLETQMKVLEAVGAEGSVDSILDSIDSLEGAMQTLVTAWACGHDEELESIVFSGTSGAPPSDEILALSFFDRNEAMADRIEGLLTEPGHSFVVVGAGHVLGDRGIPELLAQRGYATERR